MLREDGRSAEPPEPTVKHQLLFRLDGFRIAGVSPHQDVHHRHLFTKRERYWEREKGKEPAGGVGVTLRHMHRPSAHEVGETRGSKVCLPARYPSQKRVRP